MATNDSSGGSVGGLILGAIQDATAGAGTQVPAETEAPVENESTPETPEATDEVESDAEAPESGDAAADKPAAAAQKKASNATGKKEYITVSDDQGKRRRVEIDYTDRAAIKKAFEMMHGARKWQADRDKAVTESKTVRSQLDEKSKVIDALEQAYARGGEEGVIDLIAGKKGASEDWLRRKYERQKFLESATPAEIEQLKQREELEQVRRDFQALQKTTTEKEQLAEKARQEARVEATKGVVYPVFEKYRFADKLGDADAEDRFDSALWTSVMNRLGPLEEQGVEVTRSMVDDAFREEAAILNRMLSKQVEKKVSKVATDRKQKATEAAQESTMNAYKKGGVAAEAEELISNGNFRSLFSNWGKYGASLKR